MVLNSDRLRVEVAEPGVFPANTSRFDWCGFVTSVNLDGEHEFCTAEPTNLIHPSTGGIGLCNEYLCPELCAEAEIGERFVKFGIGLFTKPDQDEYCFFRKYEIQPFQMRWETDENMAVFYTEPDYSARDSLRQIKKIFVDGNVLSMETEIENTGEREIVMEEFCHNFLTIDNLRIGPEYQLNIPYINGQQKLKAGTLYGSEGMFSFSGYNAKAALLQISGDYISKETEEYEWRLAHKKSETAIQCIDEFCPARLDIWSIDHIISVETFYRIDLKRGDKCKWKRRWVFGTGGEKK